MKLKEALDEIEDQRVQLSALTKMLTELSQLNSKQVYEINVQRAWIEALLGSLADARSGLREFNLAKERKPNSVPSFGGGNFAFDETKNTWLNTQDKVALAVNKEEKTK